MKNNKNLLIITHPDLLSEWDYELNNANNIDVNTLTCGSNIKAWWRCPAHNHSFEASVKHRVGGTGCPYCASRKVLPGFNDLETLYPELIANEWNFIENEKHGLKPDMIMKNSHCKASWNCGICSGDYIMKVCDKTRGRGCPYCSGKKVLKGFNDLQSLYPDLIVSEWDWIENDKTGLKPYELTKGSNVKAWWYCDACSGYYEMEVYLKINGSGCPYCSGHRVLKGFNDLFTLYPDLIKNEWDYEHNDVHGIYPDELTKGSNVKAYWKCSDCKGNYEMSVYHKVNGRGCPYCTGNKILKGYNDLQSCYPDLVSSEWDWVENDKRGLKPDKIFPCSHVKANWHCNTCNGSYVMMVYHKTSGCGCPFCANQKVLKGYNDLLTLYPELIDSEWDYEKNNVNSIYPNSLTSGSNIKAWWNCDNCKGRYEMSIKNKIHGNGCPFCAGIKVLIGYNDLQSNYPDLVNSEWDWIENDKHGLKPYEIAKYSNMKANWSCSKCSHKWKARASDRTLKESGCPKCSHRISKQENEVAEYINNYICSHYVSISYSMMRSIKFKRIYEKIGIDAEKVLSDDLQPHLLKEIDIYIPELSLAVEYDGNYWHEDSVMLAQRGLTNDEAHRIKQKLCEQTGIKLVFITEHDWLNKNDEVKNNLASIIDKRIRMITL